MSSLQFEKLYNFRDVAESVNAFRQKTVLRPGLFYRSARPDEASANDRQNLVKDCHIQTIIDLRTTTEHINAAKRRSEAVALIEPAVAPGSDDMAMSLVKIPGVSYAEVNLNGRGFERSLIWKLSYLSLAKVIGYMALGYRMEAIQIIASEVLQPRGLIGLGIDTLEHSQPEVKQLFDILADEESWPVLVHCTKGKDRTGLTVLLVLLLCDVDVDTITYDYVRTESEPDPETEGPSNIGLDESFSKCPKDFVPKVKQHIEEQYRSIHGYLNHVGIDGEKQARIKSMLQAQP